MATPLSSDVALKLSVLLAALAAITVEDIAAVKAAGILGDDEAQNILNLQATANNVDDDTIKILNDARVAAGLQPL